MICDSCREEVPPDEIHDHSGQQLCDDCYMDAVQPVTGCDPWAVYLATRTSTSEQDFTRVQQTILQLVKDRERVRVPELLEATSLELESLRKEVATLRHMEKVIWEKRPDGEIVLKSF